MGKDPAFLFYPGDWLGGTLGMSFEEKGAYMEILMMQFSRGHMTEHMIRHVVGHYWDTLQVKFKKDEQGLWYNERLDIEVARRKNYVNSRKNNVKGVNQHTKKHISKYAHMTSHMENRNRNEIVNIITYGVHDEKRYILIIPETTDSQKIRINGEDGFNQLFEENHSIVTHPGKIRDFLFANRGAHYTSFMHVYRAFSKYITHG